jgi:hypothetical protein
LKRLLKHANLLAYKGVQMKKIFLGIIILLAANLVGAETISEVRKQLREAQMIEIMDSNFYNSVVRTSASKGFVVDANYLLVIEGLCSPQGRMAVTLPDSYKILVICSVKE